MTLARIIALPYRPNPCDWFTAIRHFSQPVLLDSCHDLSGRGRYDLVAAAPKKYLSISYQQLQEENKTLIQYLNQANQLLQNLAKISNPEQLPFTGGLIGWINYEAGYPQHSIELSKTSKAQTPAANTSEHTLPCIHMGLYLWAVINDHQEKKSFLVAHPECSDDEIAAVEKCLLQSPVEENATFQLTSSWSSNLDRTAYGEAFQQVHEYIRAGDCYQINLAQRFSATYTGDTWKAYRQLRQAAAAPFSAYIPTAAGAIISLSPETFLHFDNKGNVESKPIKGTAPRHSDKEKDRQTAEELLDSAKNRAENLMIVDLLRNDLGQCCEPGSINVDELFSLESFATVHHLVSKISGQLNSDTSPLEMLASAFPGGSITGAPKKRAMQIIQQLEPDERNIYCGSIGYLSCDGHGEFNITIRTLLAENENIYCWAGGGIVSDSKEEEEYEESLSKVRKLLSAL
jgi:para-aminobenzoate synthetase component 1